MTPKRLAVLLVACAIAAACGKDPQSRVEPPRPVRAQVAQPVDVSVALTLPGEVRPRVETRYGFRVGGKIASRLVSVGDRVAPGSVLARLDPQEVEPALAAQRALLEAARTEHRLAEVELARLQKLRAQGFISSAQVDRQQAAADGLKSRVDAAQAQLELVRNNAAFQTLRADAPGIVTAIDAEVGQVVSAGQPVVRVAGTAQVEVLVNVPEGSVAPARAAAGWSVSIPALGAKVFEARLREFSPLSDPASRTYAARLSLAGDLAGVELGMTAVAKAMGRRTSEFVLPLGVLWSRDGEPRVWIVDTATMKVRSAPVRTGGLLDDAVRVLEGISPGDTVVTAGANLLVEGQTVRLLEAPR